MNFPPAGTKCADCIHCDAAIYVAGVPICWHCDAGAPCPGPTKPAQPQKPQVVETTSKEVAPMPLKGSMRPRISEEMKTTIINADLSIPGYKLARQLGISDYSINKIRKQAGIISTARRGTKTKPDVAALTSVHPQNKSAARAIQREADVEPQTQITVTICSAITEERAQAIFARFTPALKAIALQAGLTAAMEEA